MSRAYYPKIGLGVSIRKWGMISFPFMIKMLQRFRSGRAVIGLLFVLFGAAFLCSDGAKVVLSYFGESTLYAEGTPSVSMVSDPVLSEDGSLIISYHAFDASGIKEVFLRVTPHNPLPGADNVPFDISLPIQAAKSITHTDSQDLTVYPWMGLNVDLQVVAVNENGKKGTSKSVAFTLPERRFAHPIARVLIEERKKLLEQPNDNALREEAANIMASIAHQPASFHGDPVVLMALRSGAVRLVLWHDLKTAKLINDLLWYAAVRLEDGNPVSSQRVIRDTWRDLG